MFSKLFGSEKDKRLKAVQQYKSGAALADIAKKYGVDISTIRDWIRKYDEGGPAALDFKSKKIERSKIDLVTLANEIVAEKDEARKRKLEAIFKTLEGYHLAEVANEYQITVQGLLKWRRAYEAGKL